MTLCLIFSGKGKSVGALGKAGNKCHLSFHIIVHPCALRNQNEYFNLLHILLEEQKAYGKKAPGANDLTHLENNVCVNRVIC